MNTFEVTIQRKTETGWPVVAELSGANTPLVVRDDGVLELDLLALSSQITPHDYGTTLGQALFRDNIHDAFLQARAQSEDYLSVLLSVEDPKLRTLRWERLCAPLDGRWDFLMLDQRAPLSLYLPSATDRRFPPIGRRDLRALVVVASPQGLERYQLSPFDVEAAVSSVRCGLGEVPYDVLATTKDAVGLPTLDTLCEHLTITPYSLLHVVCHGRYIANSGETILYLANESNQVAPVDGTRLIERLARLRGARGLPHFAFLSTCESASPQAEGVLGGLAQRLVRELGMPAVLAMTERVSLATAQALASNFYQRLLEHGKVDVALGEACAELAERSDITVPALYSRLGIHPLFSDTLDRDLTPDEIKFGLTRMGNLLIERAPILRQQLADEASHLRAVVGATAALSKEEREARQRALDEINKGCEEALGFSFHALALGKPPPPYDSRCPFPGLRAFRPEDQAFFFGREVLVERLQQRLNRQPFLAVLGPSGSGKSSLVLAGLVPTLLQNEPGLQLLVVTPGNDPFSQLQAGLAKVKPEQPFVLVVDQFEEVFTLCTSEEQRQAFFAQLLEVVRQQRVIITMRADFWGECAPYRNFKALMQANQELVSPMDKAELRRAIEQQATAVGLRFEADLSTTILDDVEQEPGAMPLLQHALRELWKRRHGRWLRAEEYRAIGGVQKAIAQTADALYNDEKRTPAERERIREIFVRLTKPDLDASMGEERRDSRQRVWLEELVPAESDSEATNGLIKQLADARLVVTSVNRVTGRDEVEVAHEALIRHWPRLRGWLDEERESLGLRQGIRQAAREWELGSRDEGLLIHQGSRLQECEALAKQPRHALNKLERAYLDACIDKRTRADRQRRNRNVLLGAISVLLVLTIIGALALQTYNQQQWITRLPVSVTNINDSGPGSLREAIKKAQDGDAITFAKTLTEPDGQQCTRCTITLTGGELEITKSITISGPSGSGPGERLLTISGQHKSRIFKVHTGATVTISNLVMRDGSAPKVCTWCNPSGAGGFPNFGADDDSGVGGAIFNGRSTTLALTNVIVSGSQTGTGAIFNNGALTLTDSGVSDNKTSGILNLGSATLASSIISSNAAAYGGGINNWGNLTVINSTIFGNRASNDGGGIYNLGRFKLVNSTISGNQASGGGGGIYNNIGIYIENNMGFYNGCGDGTIDYSTIYLNKAAAGGGGIASNNHNCNFGLLMQASIVASNSALSSPDISGPIVLAFLNLIQDTSGAEMSYTCQDYSPPACRMRPIVGRSPMLGPLQADKPGQPPTHALLPSSPAREQLPPDRSTSRTSESSICDNSYNNFDSSRDERGVPRPQGLACDLGAYEAKD